MKPYALVIKLYSFRLSFSILSWYSTVNLLISLTLSLVYLLALTSGEWLLKTKSIESNCIDQPQQIMDPEFYWVNQLLFNSNDFGYELLG